MATGGSCSGALRRIFGLVVPSMLTRATLLPGITLLAITADEMIHLVTILVDQSLHLLTTHARLRTGIRNGAPEPHIVADEIGTLGIFERILDVCLLHFEVAIDIASVVRLVAFRHLRMLLVCVAPNSGSDTRKGCAQSCGLSVR